MSAAGSGKGVSSASTCGSTWPCGQTSGLSATRAYSVRAIPRTSGIGEKNRSGCIIVAVQVLESRAAGRSPCVAASLRGAAVGHEAITDAAYRQEVTRRGRIILDVAPQTHDEVVDGARVGVFVHTPHVLENGFAGDRPPAVLHEVAEQACLHGRQCEAIVTAGQLERVEVDHAVREAEAVRRCPGGGGLRAQLPH